ncbi:DUF2793 domain-containing protein [uncultured Sulfitobacter sp.]|uniref:DUF2793 domain-containing protein n=1 Tax=uncultured Sulfitobacter sp. TaxID=191468 RepID=UPI002630A407|nr:DUF2793 domain-containing protein [uncultured Sulfitobacter sp.]
MPDTSPVLALPLIQPAQAQKHVTHNEALRVLDAVVQLVVIAADLSAPPTGASPGDRYIVASPASGSWTGHAGEIALYADDAWSFIAPQAGWSAQVLTPKGTLVFDPVAGWEAAGGGAVETTQQLGINATADTTNRLSLSADATLLNHEGAGHQLKLNKATVADTASLLYQTAFSGRAEMGLAGDDSFAIKVSADGGTWHEALRANPATGGLQIPHLVTGLGVTQSPNDTTPGRLMRTGDGYVKATLLGTVSETAGVPTGAVIERGSTANGEYVRFADGTQICTREIGNVDTNIAAGAVFRSNIISVDYAKPFVSGSLVVGAASSVNTGLLWVNGRATSHTEWKYTAFSYASRTSDTIALMAVGRWF